MDFVASRLKQLHGLKKMGFNRITFGVQSFDDLILKRINRNHTASQALHAIETAKSCGFDNYKKYNYSDLLPKRFEEEVIVGGNHAYFGMYGEQDGDGVATIKPEKQIRDTANYIAKFILK